MRCGDSVGRKGFRKRRELARPVLTGAGGPAKPASADDRKLARRSESAGRHADDVDARSEALRIQIERVTAGHHFAVDEERDLATERVEYGHAHSRRAR